MKTPNEEKKLTYSGIHMWIRRIYGKAKYCSKNTAHKSKRYEWANISGEYKRDISDFIQLCVSCHRKMDYTEKQKELIRISRMGKPANNCRKVSQYNQDGTFVKIYSSIEVASIVTGTNRTAIFNNLSGRYKTAGGYIWH